MCYCLYFNLGHASTEGSPHFPLCLPRQPPPLWCDPSPVPLLVFKVCVQHVCITSGWLPVCRSCWGCWSTALSTWHLGGYPHMIQHQVLALENLHFRCLRGASFLIFVVLRIQTLTSHSNLEFRISAVSLYKGDFLSVCFSEYREWKQGVIFYLGLVTSVLVVFKAPLF